MTTPTPLDPIVSLTVALAEAPGSYAFLLGAGVSRDAGVPTGGEVFTRAAGDLYRLELETVDTPPAEALASWLTNTGRDGWGYGDVLAEIAPDPAARRDYLARHFEGTAPGATHTALADLAARGYVRIFVTTNFDRLLEHALQARGIEPVVVTSDADLAVATPREHARCYVLKPHGDYLQQTIRNTPRELATLEPQITAALGEIADRHGLVALGYSGADEAIGMVLRGRRSRYGMYWVARGALGEPARTLIEAIGGRVIVRPDAAAFLTDLSRRLTIFAAHPTGRTPHVVHDELLLLVRARDDVGARELVRSEQRAFDGAISSYLDGHRQQNPTAELMAQAHDDLMPILERRLATLLVAVLYDEGLWREQLSALADSAERPGRRDGYIFWPELTRWTTWWLLYAAGALAVRVRRWSALTPLFAADVTNPEHGVRVPLMTSVPAGSGYDLSEAVLARYGSTRWLDPSWKVLESDVASLSLLEDRVPELTDEDEPARSMAALDFLVCVQHGLRDEEAVAHWAVSASRGGVDGFARQLHSDRGLRAKVAEAFGLSLEEFDSRAPEALRRAHVARGGSTNTAAINILATGSSS